MTILLDNLSPISPVVALPAVAVRPVGGPAFASSRARELPSGVCAIGEVLPLVLVELGIGDPSDGSLSEAVTAAS